MSPHRVFSSSTCGDGLDGPTYFCFAGKWPGGFMKEILFLRKNAINCQSLLDRDDRGIKKLDNCSRTAIVRKIDTFSFLFVRTIFLPLHVQL